MTKISAVLIAHNEEQHIEECLQSLTWVDEIIVVDDSSTDATASIAKKYTKHVYAHTSVGYVEPARAFAISKTSNRWIVLVDADERIPESLANKLTETLKQKPTYSAIAVPRKNLIFNKWIEHTGWWPDYNIRVFDKEKVKWSNKIHSQPEVTGEVLKLEAHEKFAIIHHNYSSVSQYLEKMMRYTDIQAEEYQNSKKQISFTAFITLPTQEFVRRYFAGKGYKDGTHGLVLSTLQAVSEFVLVLKVWEKQGFKQLDDQSPLQLIQKQVLSVQKECMYWIANELMDEEKGKLARVKYRLMRKRARK